MTSCNRKPESLSIDKYLAYINNPENGLVKNTSVNGVTLTLKYLPKEYLSYLDSVNFKGDTLKRGATDYSNSITFLLNIASEEASQQIMSKDIATIEEYKERMLTMSFSLREYISIKYKQGEIAPVLVELENTYDILSDKSIYVVFSAEEVNKHLGSNSDFKFVFVDDFFSTGISVFTIKQENISDLPFIKG